MFHQFLPSEFNTHGIAYSRQLKEALIINSWDGPRGLNQLLDEHFQRWLNCDIKDVKIAVHLLEKQTQTAQIKSVRKAATNAIGVYNYQSRWLGITATEISPFLTSHKHMIDAMGELNRHIQRPETLFLAYRLFDVLAELYAFEPAIQLAQKLSLDTEQSRPSQNQPKTNPTGNPIEESKQQPKTTEKQPNRKVLASYEDFLTRKHMALLNAPTVYTFLDMLLCIFKISNTLPFYFAELALVSKVTNVYTQSQIAAACLFLSNASQEREFWPYGLEQFTRIEYTTVKRVAAYMVVRAKTVMENTLFQEKYAAMDANVLTFGIHYFKNVVEKQTVSKPLDQSTLPNKIQLEILKKILGKGASGSVMKGKYNGRNCAIKQLTSKRLFNREISLLMIVKSKYVIQLLDFGVYPSRKLSIVLPLGEDFYTKLESSELKQRIKWGIELMKAVRHCHLCGIMHRDIKPENVLIRRGRAKLCDFNLARRVYVTPRTYTLSVATIWWRAPELLLGNAEYTEKIDVWSMGVVLCQCIDLESILKFAASRSASPERKSGLNQLLRLWQLFGTPTEETWPGVSGLPQFDQTWEPVANTGIVNELPSATDSQIATIQGMLQLNPERRLTMSAALHLIS